MGNQFIPQADISLYIHRIRIFDKLFHFHGIKGNSRNLFVFQVTTKFNGNTFTSIQDFGDVKATYIVTVDGDQMAQVQKYFRRTK